MALSLGLGLGVANGGGVSVPLIDTRPNLFVTADFSHASWSKANITIASSTETAPDGTATAFRITENVTGAVPHTLYKLPTLTADQHTASVFAKAGARTQLAFLGQFTSYGTTYFNLATGAVISTGIGHTPKITNVGGGWYRCSITGTAAAAAQEFDIMLASGGTFSYAGDGTSDFYLWQPWLGVGGPM